MANLRQEHPALYRRIVRKALLHDALGIALLLTPPLDLPNARQTIIHEYLTLDTMGTIFLLFGAGLTIGLFLPKNNYKVAKLVLFAALGHAVIYELALLLSLKENVAAISITVLWTYFVSNMWEVSTDDGWNTIQVLKDSGLEASDGR